MAEEVKPGFVDSLFEKTAKGIDQALKPMKPASSGLMWYVYTYTHLTAFVEWVGEWGISRGLLLSSFYIAFLTIASSLLPNYFSLAFGWIFLALPAIAVVGGIMVFWAVWVWYVQSLSIFTRTDPVLLEVKMPADITKSPRAMENVFSNLWIRYSTTTFIDRNWYGGTLPFFSFELVSLGGEVHFYIWTRRIFKNTIETNLYAQYPEVEVVEAEDYAQKFVYDENVECFVTDYALQSNVADAVDPLNPDSAAINAYTPKSYIDFELDKDPKEEHRVDPYASVIEVLSAMNKNEQMWIQMVIRPYFDKDWKKAVEGEVEKIRIASTKLEKKANGEVEEDTGFPRPTWKQTEQIRIMERHLSKLPFQVGFRGIYTSPAGKQRSPEYTMMRWIWRPFANPNWMSVLRPRRGHNIFDFAWQDWNGIRYRLFSRRFLDAYRRRCVFNYPWITPYHIFSTEMLATLWHPPSNTAAAPGLARIPVAKAEAPSNLPV